MLFLRLFRCVDSRTHVLNFELNFRFESHILQYEYFESLLQPKRGNVGPFAIYERQKKQMHKVQSKVDDTSRIRCLCWSEKHLQVWKWCLILTIRLSFHYSFKKRWRKNIKSESGETMSSLLANWTQSGSASSSGGSSSSSTCSSVEDRRPKNVDVALTKPLEVKTEDLDPMILPDSTSYPGPSQRGDAKALARYRDIVKQV